jgi:hypothetical protein
VQTGKETSKTCLGAIPQENAGEAGAHKYGRFYGLDRFGEVELRIFPLQQGWCGVVFLVLVEVVWAGCRDQKGRSFRELAGYGGGADCS